MRKASYTTVVSEQEFTVAGVDLLAGDISSALATKGFCILGFSGGSTPRAIYEELGKATLDWSKVWIFLVDDRAVVADHPKSNQFLLRSTLLKHAAIPESQIIFPDTSLPVAECVRQYDLHLQDLLKKGKPNCITLGMGDDGHIASLFPPVPGDARKGCAIHTTTDKFDIHDRISVTFPVLTAAEHALFLLKGADKKRVWDEMTADAADAKRWPAKAVLEAVPTDVLALP